jgi:hypothetical protein
VRTEAQSKPRISRLARSPAAQAALIVQDCCVGSNGSSAYARELLLRAKKPGHLSATDANGADFHGKLPVTCPVQFITFVGALACSLFVGTKVN